MKFYNTFKGRDGSYRTTEFSANDMFNIDIIVLLIYGALGTLLSTFASGILILVTLHDFEDERAKPSIWGALISIYFLLDVTHHWIMWVFLRLIYGFKEEGDYWITFFTHINISFLVTHIVLIVLGGTFYFNGPRETAKSRLVMTMIGICVTAYFCVRDNF